MATLPGGRAPYGESWNGKVWSDAAGGYVAPTTPSATAATNATNAAAGTIATGTAAGTYHAPMSAAEQAASTQALAALAEGSRHNTATEGLTGLGIRTGAATSAATLAEQARESTASNTLATNKFNQTVTDRASALQALQGLWSGHGAPGTGLPMGGQTPEGGGLAGDPGGAGGGAGMPSLEQEAETAALTTSKERGGERVASSLKALRDFNAASGGSRVGSGLEARDARSLFASNLGDQNDTERSIIASKVGRAQSLADAARQRDAQVQDRNFAAQQALQKSYLDSLLSVYGMGY